MNLEQDIADVVQECQQTIPFNNTSKVRLALNEPVDPRLGGNCIHQARCIAAALAPFPGSTRFAHASKVATLIPTDHYAVLKETDGGAFLIDLTLMQDRPIFVPCNLDDFRETSSPARPVINGEHSVVTVKSSGPTAVNVALHLLDGPRSHIRTHNVFYDIRATDSLPANDDKKIAAKEHWRYALRFLNKTGFATVEYEVRRRKTTLIYGSAANLWGRCVLDAGQDAIFRTTLDGFVAPLGLDSESVLSHLHATPSMRDRLMKCLAPF